MSKTVRIEAGVKLRDADKMALIPVKFMPETDDAPLPKPDWMRIRLPASGEDSSRQEHHAQEQPALGL